MVQPLNGTADAIGCQTFLGLCLDSNRAPEECPIHSARKPEDIERAAELRAADSSRCRHRGVTPIRFEPCACPIIAELPVYHCDHFNADCADVRQPQPPANFCRDCPARI